MDPVSKAQSIAGNSSQYRGFKPGQSGNPGKCFKPGQSGNPKGRPKKAPITQIFEKIFRNAQNRKDIERSILKILLQGKMASVLMLREAVERLEGKVIERIELPNEALSSLSDAELAEKLVKMDEELAKRIEGLSESNPAAK